MAKHSAPSSRSSRPRRAGVVVHSPWRIGLISLLAVALIATLTGLVLLWPRSEPQEHVSPEFTRTYALNQPQVTGTVEYTDSNLCHSPATGLAFDTPPMRPAAEEPADCARSFITLTSGQNAGRNTQLVFWGVAGDPTLEAGDEILLSESTDEEGTVRYSFADYQRSGELWMWAAIIAIIIIAFAAWQGVRSLVGLGYTLGVVFVFLLPALIEGSQPLFVGIVACATIVLVAIPLVHGVNWKSASALGGSLTTLALAALVAWATIDSTRLEGFSSEDNLKLLLYLPSVSIVGVLLCGFIIGALGGLNDVAIAQASTITELYAADPKARPGQLFVSAMKVGRDHIGSMVYTIVLSYTGATLPLLILISAAERPLGQVLTSDLVATELLRSGVGAVALTLTVPITTFIAALTVPDRRPTAIVSQTDPA
ncbi:YibE/F family protein [Corynebacterium lizhenjunii]|uniref:YibE/F family protein n=1 Tax=Corynebacterium lizhenjunii TaxID=2709394 RepID=A0A7T0KDW4_9CORY|nr:YibE/F family protein [Corynebacterium lizhenjunii]QPK78981.1 YibE/F family protein [Corynebacterium lizhenjunii]